MNKEQFMKLPGAKEEHWLEWLQHEEDVAADREYRKKFSEVDPEFHYLLREELITVAGGDYMPAMDKPFSQPYVIVQHKPTGLMAYAEHKSQLKGRIECFKRLRNMLNDWDRLKESGLELHASG